GLGVSSIPSGKEFLPETRLGGPLHLTVAPGDTACVKREVLETAHHGGLGSGEEVPVPIEDDRHRAVASPRSDLLGARSRSDPERDRRVTEIVRTKGRETRPSGGRQPVPRSPGVSAERAAIAARKHKS